MSAAEHHVFITGVSSGIGAAALQLCLQCGWRVTGVARRQERLDALMAQLPATQQEQCCLVVADVCDEAAMRAAANLGVDQHGAITAVVANAGQGYDGSLLATSPDSLRQLMDINIIGVHISLRIAAMANASVDNRNITDQELLATTPARVIIVSSIVGLVALPGMAGYSASKHAIQAYADALRIELRPHRIQVTTINPGTVATEFFDQAPQGGGQGWRLRPKRWLTAASVAATIVQAINAKRPPRLIIRPRYLRLALWLAWWSPSLWSRISRRGLG